MACGSEAEAMAGLVQMLWFPRQRSWRPVLPHRTRLPFLLVLRSHRFSYFNCTRPLESRVPMFLTSAVA